MKFIKKHFWLFASFSGLFLSVIVTLVILIWELIENPGGVFRDKNGINWSSFYDTAISWFIPTFIFAVITVSVAYVSMALIKRLLQAWNQRKT